MKKYTILAATLLFAVVGCQNDIDNLSVKPAEKVTLKATLEQPVGTRTTLDEDLNVLWSENDAIVVIGATDPENPVVYDLYSGEGTDRAAFVGDAVEGDVKAAVYPARFFDENSSGDVDGNTFYVPVVIPTTQKAVLNNMPENANLAVAVGNDVFEFKNVMGLLKLQLYGTAARPIKSIQIAAFEALAGNGVVTIDGENEPTLEFLDNISKVITLELPENTVISADEANPTVVYAVVPAGAFAGGLTVSVASDQARVLLSNNRTTVDNTVARSTVQAMPAADVRFTFYLDQLANTYVVEPNGSIDIGPFRPDGKLVGHVKSGGYSAQYAFTAITNQNPRGTVTNYVNYAKYNANEYEGNVLVVARDQDNVALWSWMIWQTDEPQDIELKNGVIIQDRNLGAICAVPDDKVANVSETYGMRFQFGRKDPVFNASTNKIETSPEVGTTDYVTKNPIAFITPLDTTLAEHQDWLGDWKWEGDRTLWNVNKGLYDPCPAGYRVPDGGTGSFWVTLDFKTNALKTFGEKTADAAGYFADDLGYWFDVTNDAEKPLYIPRGSYYDPSPTLYTGGIYWCYPSVLMTKGGYYGRCFRVTYSTKSGNSVSNSTTSQRAYAGFVRCQKIQ